jgi:uncharacterized iron-regulated protein
MNILMTLKKLKQSLKYLLNVFICLLFLLQGSVSAKQEPEGWQSPFFQDNRLVGKIWDTHKRAWISMQQLNTELVQYDYILMGEVHTNHDHHLLQARLINTLVNSGAKPTIVMEMLSNESWQDQPKNWVKADELQELANMLNDGWPWSLYAPILQSVVNHQLDLYAGNISSKNLQRWSSEQGEVNKENLLREYSYTKENFTKLEKTIIDSHCGHANPGLINYMSRAQMKRDRFMATSLIDKKTPVVFIAGSGHVRNDYAVPMQLRRNFNETSYLSIAFVPVLEGEETLKAYLQDESSLDSGQDDGQDNEQVSGPDLEPGPGIDSGIDSELYDILYFTPNHTNEDPCVKFRKQLKNMQHKPQ